MSSRKSAVRRFSIFSCDGKTMQKAKSPIITETALAVSVNGQTAAVIACAGNHLDELAAGYLRSERMIASIKDVEMIAVDKKSMSANVILKDKRTRCLSPVKDIASSGARSRRPAPAAWKPLETENAFLVDVKTAFRLMNELLDNSVIHNETHGTHCSALARDGRIIALREDIGRHNTIDMLGGYALLNRIDTSGLVLLTTGRVSAEIVFKVWNLGISVIISHSAPTSKAIELLRRAGMTMIGYVRGGRMNIYSHERRVII